MAKITLRESHAELLKVLRVIRDWYEEAGYNGNGPSGCALLFDDDRTLGTHIREAIEKAERA